MVAQLWAEAVGTALGSDDDARRELDRFVAALPPGYVEETAPEDAAGDWSAIRSWLASGATGNPPPAAAAGALVLSGCRGGAPGDFRLRRSGPRRIELSSSLPVLESFGLATVESVPWHFVFAQGVEAYVDDIGLRVVTPVTADAGPTAFGPRLVDALNAVWQGNADLTPLNALVVGAGLGWREVGLLCAYCGYRGVVGGPRSADRAAAIANALIAFPTVAAAIVDLFDTLLRQGVGGHTAADERLAAVMLEVPDLAHYEA
ncbi:MAG TPA: hypothetical protein VME46_16865, partial [Acidimicrobiales bacterium]|nr:hypothetical protein [Acidimicrobiales bacterium]